MPADAFVNKISLRQNGHSIQIDRARLQNPEFGISNIEEIDINIVRPVFSWNEP